MTTAAVDARLQMTPAVREARLQMTPESTADEAPTTVDAPAVDDASAAVDEPAADDASTAVDEPAADDASTAVDEPAADDASTVVDAPAADDASAAADAPALDEALAAVDAPAADEASTGARAIDDVAFTKAVSLIFEPPVSQEGRQALSGECSRLAELAHVEESVEAAEKFLSLLWERSKGWAWGAPGGEKQAAGALTVIGQETGWLSLDAENPPHATQDEPSSANLLEPAHAQSAQNGAGLRLSGPPPAGEAAWAREASSQRSRGMSQPEAGSAAVAVATLPAVEALEASGHEEALRSAQRRQFLSALWGKARAWARSASEQKDVELGRGTRSPKASLAMPQLEGAPMQADTTTEHRYKLPTTLPSPSPISFSVTNQDLQPPLVPSSKSPQRPMTPAVEDETVTEAAEDDVLAAAASKKQAETLRREGSTSAGNEVSEKRGAERRALERRQTVTEAAEDETVTEAAEDEALAAAASKKQAETLRREGSTSAGNEVSEKRGAERRALERRQTVTEAAEDETVTEAAEDEVLAAAASKKQAETLRREGSTSGGNEVSEKRGGNEVSEKRGAERRASERRQTVTEAAEDEALQKEGGQLTPELGTQALHATRSSAHQIALARLQREAEQQRAAAQVMARVQAKEAQKLAQAHLAMQAQSRAETQHQHRAQEAVARSEALQKETQERVAEACSVIVNKRAAAEAERLQRARELLEHRQRNQERHTASVMTQLRSTQNATSAAAEVATCREAHVVRRGELQGEEDRVADAVVGGMEEADSRRKAKAEVAMQRARWNQAQSGVGVNAKKLGVQDSRAVAIELAETSASVTLRANAVMRFFRAQAAQAAQAELEARLEADAELFGVGWRAQSDTAEEWSMRVDEATAEGEPVMDEGRLSLAVMEDRPANTERHLRSDEWRQMVREAKRGVEELLAGKDEDRLAPSSPGTHGSRVPASTQAHAPPWRSPNTAGITGQRVEELVLECGNAQEGLGEVATGESEAPSPAQRWQTAMEFARRHVEVPETATAGESRALPSAQRWQGLMRAMGLVKERTDLSHTRSVQNVVKGLILRLKVIESSRSQEAEFRGTSVRTDESQVPETVDASEVPEALDVAEVPETVVSSKERANRERDKLRELAAALSTEMRDIQRDVHEAVERPRAMHPSSPAEQLDMRRNVEPAEMKTTAVLDLQ
ncbi:hypothetical protein CYMTET_8888, partial [Cymbomonas tetramitiformis]